MNEIAALEAGCTPRDNFQGALDDGVARGHASFPHGFDWPAGARVGSLISPTTDVDALTGMVRQSSIQIELGPAVDTPPRGTRD